VKRIHACGLAAMLALALVLPAASAAAEPETTPAFPAPEVRAWQTGLLRPDRLQHVSLSATLSMSCGLASHSAPAGYAFGFGLGVLKELWDARHDRFDWMDLAADAAGAGIGAAVADALSP